MLGGLDPRAATQVTRTVARGDVEVRVLQSCALEVRSGPAAGARARIERPLFRVGSHPSNDLALDDPTVSKHHLEIEATPDGWRVSDLSSSNGTFLGAARVGTVTLVEPVELTLGAARVGFVPGVAEAELPASQRDRFGNLVGRSPAMRELFHTLEAIAASDCTVVIEGETGVGKELVAESLHLESARAAGPFVVVDCAALSGPLLESELFGHLRGAFSGAERDKPGLLAIADGGTVLLDEVGELPLALQAKLLGAIERRRVTPVGGTRAQAIDVRVLAATHRDLARAVNEGRFRADLFYRLAVVRLRVPPLRERREDVPLLVQEILRGLAERAPDAPAAPELSAIALARLAAQPWPGNVRELRNAVERAALRLGEPSPGEPAPEREPFARARERAIAEWERDALLAHLERAAGNVSEAAREAGMDRRNFQRLLRRHGLEPRALRPR